MRRPVFIAALLLALGAAPASIAATAQSLIGGCEVELPEFRTDKIVIWDGACVDGKAEGPGVLGAHGMKITGTFRKGAAFDATGTMVASRPDGAKEVVQVLVVQGNWRQTPFADAAGRMDLPAQIIGNWKLVFSNGHCGEFIDFAAPNASVRYSGSAEVHFAVDVFPIEGHPDWLTLRRTKVSAGTGGDCAFKSSGWAFEVDTIHVRLSDQGWRLCTGPQEEACVASAERVSPEAAGRRTRTMVASLGARTGSTSVAIAESDAVVLDRNTGVLRALYARALRDNGKLRGRVNLELDIAPTGVVTDCRILSSELNEPELEKKLCARARFFRFKARENQATISREFAFEPDTN